MMVEGLRRPFPVPLAVDGPYYMHSHFQTRRRFVLLVSVIVLSLNGKVKGGFASLHAARAGRFCHGSLPRKINSVDVQREYRLAGFPMHRKSAVSRIEPGKVPTSSLYVSPLPEENSVNESSSNKERNRGILVLCTVPLAWGTFEPAVRYVYAMKPTVPGFVFSVGYYMVASLSLSVLAFVSMMTNETKENQTATASDSTDRQQTSLSLPILGGLELGTYLFLGNGLQVLGLKTVPSDRAAFLLQLTTIFVPLVQAMIAGNFEAIPLKTWGACVLALTGVAVMGLDGATSEGDSVATTLQSSLDGLTQGDFMIILAALAYTFHCIRLGKYARETPAILLAACKAITETLWSLALVLALVAFASSTEMNAGGISSFVSQQGSEISNYMSAISGKVSSNSLSLSTLAPALAAVVWTGVVTCGYTIYAQSYGQSRVNPTDANLIYTIQPIFTALFAFGLLGETLGPAGYIGGALIGSAVFIVTTSDGKSAGKIIVELDEGEDNALELINGDTSAIGGRLSSKRSSSDFTSSK